MPHVTCECPTCDCHRAMAYGRAACDTCHVGDHADSEA